MINETPNKKHGKSSLQNDCENGVGEMGFHLAMLELGEVEIREGL